MTEVDAVEVSYVTGGGDDRVLVEVLSKVMKAAKVSGMAVKVP